ncbi:MAG: NAD(P)/FAD-dependent oxidoreductase, partial [Deltaproteobacteria bacterium]
VKGLAGFDKAVITSGGIELSEIEPKTMRSKLVKNLYFAGEILDLDGPTGGYNLQVCWSTGYAAGQAVA